MYFIYLIIVFFVKFSFGEEPTKPNLITKPEQSSNVKSLKSCEIILQLKTKSLHDLFTFTNNVISKVDPKLIVWTMGANYFLGDLSNPKTSGISRDKNTNSAFFFFKNNDKIHPVFFVKLEPIDLSKNNVTSNQPADYYAKETEHIPIVQWISKNNGYFFIVDKQWLIFSDDFEFIQMLSNRTNYDFLKDIINKVNSPFFNDLHMVFSLKRDMIPEFSFQEKFLQICYDSIAKPILNEIETLKFEVSVSGENFITNIDLFAKQNTELSKFLSQKTGGQTSLLNVIPENANKLVFAKFDPLITKNFIRQILINVISASNEIKDYYISQNKIISSKKEHISEKERNDLIIKLSSESSQLISTFISLSDRWFDQSDGSLVNWKSSEGTSYVFGGKFSEIKCLGDMKIFCKNIVPMLSDCTTLCSKIFPNSFASDLKFDFSLKENIFSKDKINIHQFSSKCIFSSNYLLYKEPKEFLDNKQQTEKKMPVEIKSENYISIIHDEYYFSSSNLETLKEFTQNILDKKKRNTKTQNFITLPNSLAYVSERKNDSQLKFIVKNNVPNSCTYQITFSIEHIILFAKQLIGTFFAQ